MIKFNAHILWYFIGNVKHFNFTHSISGSAVNEVTIKVLAFNVNPLMLKCPVKNELVS